MSLAGTVTAAAEYKAVFAPLAPHLSVAATSLKGVRLCWTNLAWATQYDVWRGTSSNRGQASKIAMLGNDGVCEYLDASGVENQNYWYWVEAMGVEDDVWSGGVQGRREKKTFAIAYANLRGAAHANPDTYREGTSFSFASPTPRRGYTFVRWEPDGISTGTSGDVTVRAIWSQNTFAVQYDANGGSGSLAETGFTYGFWKYIEGAGFNRTGYAFEGWSTNVSGTVVYGAGESVKNLTAQADGVVTLHAVWRLVDAIPEIGGDEEVAEALAGAADGRLAEYIKTAAEYNAFRAWVDSRGLDHKKVKDSPRAWLSYALDAEGLIEREFQKGDVAIDSLKTADGGVFAFEVNVAGVRIGMNATAENLVRVFSVEGTFDLSGGQFSSETVTATFGATAEGRLSVVAVPKSACSSFFIRVCMMIGVQ